MCKEENGLILCCVIFMVESETIYGLTGIPFYNL